MLWSLAYGLAKVFAAASSAEVALVQARQIIIIKTQIPSTLSMDNLLTEYIASGDRFVFLIFIERNYGVISTGDVLNQLVANRKRSAGLTSPLRSKSDLMSYFGNTSEDNQHFERMA